MSKKVVGMESGVNKKYNTPYTVMHTISDFEKYSVDNRNAIGSKVETTYIRKHVNVKLNDNVEYVYAPGFNNEAVVVDVTIIK